MAPLVDGIVLADKLSETSKTQYLEKLATLTKLLDKPVEYLVDNPQAVVAAIRQRYACPLTQRAFVVAIKALFHHNDRLKLRRAEQYQQYEQFQTEMSKAVQERYMNAEPSDKERRNWVPWAEVLAKERELAAREYGSPDHLLLAMYCLIEPLRQDYGALRILVDRRPPAHAKGNFLAIAADGSWGSLVLNTYKTAKSYGTYERSLPPTLLAVIKASLLAHPRAYLFVDESGQPYRKKNSFTKFSNRTLQRLFGKAFTVSMMRHSHISDIDFNASTPGELIEKSRNMAHSLPMQQMYRRKVEPEPPLTVVKSSHCAPLTATPPPPTGLVVGADGERYIALAL
jgi:integrase